MKCVFCGELAHMGKPCKKIVETVGFAVANFKESINKKERRELEDKISYSCKKAGLRIPKPSEQRLIPKSTKRYMYQYMKDKYRRSKNG